MSEPPLIDAIRRRPGMYFGGKSLSALYHFVHGYQIACSVHHIEDDRLRLDIPRDFHDWVAYRTHHQDSTPGWCHMIVSTTESEEDAFDRFFALLDEHSSRVPTVVAEILNPISSSRRKRDGQDVLIPAPTKVQLVKYTDDPGFFALHDSEDWTDRFYRYLSRIYGLDGGELVIHDEGSYQEMLCEDEQLAEQTGAG